MGYVEVCTRYHLRDQALHLPKVVFVLFLSTFSFKLTVSVELACLLDFSQLDNFLHLQENPVTSPFSPSLFFIESVDSAFFIVSLEYSLPSLISLSFTIDKSELRQ